MQKIYEQCGQLTFLEPMSGARDFPVRTSALQENASDSRESVQACFSQLQGLLKTSRKKNRPSYLFFENVKNLLSVNGGFDFARILIELDEIGYDAEWTVINSADVVPQNRERVFIVGHLRSRRGRKIFPVGENNGEINRHDIKQICNISPTKTRSNPNQGRVYDTSGIAPCLNCMSGGGLEPKIAVPAAAYGMYTNASPDFMRQPLEEKSRCLKSNKADAGVIIKTATKQDFEFARVNKDNVNFTFPSSKTKRGRVDKDRAHTLDTACNQGVIVYNGENYFIRKLTPLECWRLQGWEDEYFFRAFFLDKGLAHKFNKAYQRHRSNPVRLMRWAFGHQKMSDSQLYKQAGNGVTVTVIKQIAEKFRLEEREDEKSNNGQP